MAVSSLLLRAVAAAVLLQPALGAYKLEDNFSGASFFDNFEFFTDADPTQGFVSYIGQSAASSAGLISAQDGQPAYFGVDSTSVLNADIPGRKSVRITSKKSYTHALIISDIVHMPGGICGTWPAHWTLGPNWPSNGEIDIIEGVNNAATNLMSLHTSPGCTIAGANQTGTLQSNDCQTGEFNIGCGVTSSTSASYGTGFNGGLGGVYATEWTSSYIRIYFFPRGQIPADITAGTPDPSLWGLPQANLQGTCDIDSKFANHQIIFDTTFCGAYGNADWNKNAQCMALQPGATCAQYVAANPSAFTNAYWSVNSVKVYQQDTPVATNTVPVPTNSVIPVSSVLAPGMGNSSIPATATGTTTSTYAAATKPVTTATAPASVGNFRYLGCASSVDAFRSFIQIDNNAAMTLEKCVADCSAFNYAGVFNTLCFCGNSLGSATVSSANTCDNACPGNLNQLCGGSLASGARMARRQASALILLSLYQRAASAPLISVVPASQTLGYGMGLVAPPSTNLVLSTTYINVCGVCEGGYTTIPFTTTIARCGCAANEASTIAMQAVATACAACGPNGGSGTVTVTVPYAVAAATGVSPATGAVFTGTATAAATGPAVVTAASRTAAQYNGTQTAVVSKYTGAAAGKVAGSIGALVAAGGAALAML